MKKLGKELLITKKKDGTYLCATVEFYPVTGKGSTKRAAAKDWKIKALQYESEIKAKTEPKPKAEVIAKFKPVRRLPPDLCNGI